MRAVYVNGYSLTFFNGYYLLLFLFVCLGIVFFAAARKPSHSIKGEHGLNFMITVKNMYDKKLLFFPYFYMIMTQNYYYYYYIITCHND